MRDYIAEYLFTRRAENAAPNTVRAYRADIEELAGFVGGGRWAEQLTRTVVRAFIGSLSKRGLEQTSMARKLAALKSFAMWLRVERLLVDDVCYGITSLRPPKLPKKLPDVPSQEEIATLLNGPFPTAFPERDRLLCELMYGDGLRVAEAANIRLDDLRPEQNAILIHGKGGMYGKAAKERLVPLNRRCADVLQRYLIVRAKKLKVETTVLFFAARNRYAKSPADVGPIDVRSVHRMVLYMTQVRGLQPMHPHVLRHACATHMLENGCPLDVIGKVLGHDNLDITAHYAQVSTRLMMRAYNAAHPHAELDLRTKIVA